LPAEKLSTIAIRTTRFLCPYQNPPKKNSWWRDLFKWNGKPLCIPTGLGLTERLCQPIIGRFIMPSPSPTGAGSTSVKGVTPGIQYY